jgi:RND family efflux transporter MFP subunit
MMRHWKTAVMASAAILVAACEKEPVKVETPVRAIKTFTVTEVASGQTRKFSGIVQAANTSALSFQVGGNVQKVLVNLGDRVKKGQLLAVLDKKPYQLDVQAANAELGRARAGMAQQKEEYTRQRKLFSQGWIAKARLDRAERSFKSAANTVEYARSKLGIARRDLSHTVLRAPFDGVIAKKSVDPFVEVKAGQKLFEIDAKGTLEVAFDVPETAISRIAVGMPFSAQIAGVANCGCKGRITEIGEVAQRGNAFPVKAALREPPGDIRSGMTAEVMLSFDLGSGPGGLFIPFQALAPSDKPQTGHVFVFDAKTSTVRKTLVSAQSAERDMVAVRGIKPGDIIAIAGVNFLVDGQKVKLMQ